MYLGTIINPPGIFLLSSLPTVVITAVLVTQGMLYRK